ncbi:NADH-quinone oxidoreductase subunit N [Thermosulfuriphilus sp.]
MEAIIPNFDLQTLIWVMGPQLVVLITGLLVILIDLFIKKFENLSLKANILGIISVTGLIYAGGLTATTSWSAPRHVFMGIFSMEPFTALFCLILILAGVIAVLLGIGYTQNNRQVKGEFFALMLFAIYGSLAMVQAVDLLMMFIALETMSLAVYVLAGYLKGNARSQEAAFKYFLLGCFGSSFILFGMAFLYGLTGSLNLADIAAKLAEGHYQNIMAMAGLALICAGFFFKVAFAPFHMWTPDVYEGSPSVVTGYMATAVKAAAFATFLKILTICFTPLLSTTGEGKFIDTAVLEVFVPYWKTTLVIVSFLTMLIGNLLGIIQQNIKRMLAYSSIAHAGYIGLGILAGDELGRTAVIFYLAVYTLMNLGAFGIVFLFDQYEGQAQELPDYAGLAYKYPVLSALMAIFMFAMAGVPPMAGFAGKFYLFAAAIKSGYLLLAAVGILTSAIGAYYYLRVIIYLYMREPEKEVIRGQVAIAPAVAIAATAIGIIYLGLRPDTLYAVAEAAQKSILYIF